MQQERETKGGQTPLTGSVEKERQSFQTIVVKKEREEEYDQDILSQWKEARSNFFNQTIKQKLNQAKIQQQNQIKIIQTFMEVRQNDRKLALDFLKQSRTVCDYKHIIDQLNQSFGLMNYQFSRRQKETPAITQIIQLKLTELRVISIQYSLTIFDYYRYQVSAFDLFEVIHNNRGLSSATFKGVLVKDFKNFLKAMTKSKFNQIKEQKNEKWGQIKNFKPSKSLKVAIDLQQKFNLTDEEDLSTLMDLAEFGGMFQQLSIISLKIELKKQKELAEVWSVLQQLMTQLTTIGKLRIQIEGEYCQTNTDEHFTMILQMLCSLKTIAQLQLSGISLSRQVSINRFLAMEQMLSTIFENNAITHLSLDNCHSLPLLPSITTLQWIYLYRISFRRQFSFMSVSTRSSPCLKSIKYSLIKQEWRIEEQLFDQLQQLQIGWDCYYLSCPNVFLGISTHSPSKIKRLRIDQLNSSDLSLMFPKLVHITELMLSKVNFGHQLLCTIPSPYLTFLCIRSNKIFTNKGLEAIDKKWPKLRQLHLGDCPNVEKDGWSACGFKGLKQLSTNLLPNNDSIRRQLRGRGIKVY